MALPFARTLVAIVALVGIVESLRGEEPAGLPTYNLAGASRTAAMLSHQKMRLPADRSAVWCGSFCLAVQSLERDSPRASSLRRYEDSVSGALNEPFEVENLRPDRAVVRSDRGTAEFWTECQREIERRFVGVKPTLPAPVEPGGSAMSYFAMAPMLDSAFSARPAPLEFRAGAETIPVRAFVIEGGRFGDLVRVLAYENERSFVVELATSERDCDLWLAAVPPGDDLSTTIERAQKLVSSADGKPSTAPPHGLIAPDLNVQAEKIEAVMPATCQFPKPSDIVVVYQGVQFKLEAPPRQATSANPAQLESGYLTFDGPFLVLFKEKSSSRPFFAAWIADASALVPW